MKKIIDTKRVSISTKRPINIRFSAENQAEKINKALNNTFPLVAILSLFLCFLTFSTFSQEKLDETYKVISNPTNESLDNYIIAMNNSNFECYRFETLNRILVFKSGVTVELLSYKQVTESGNPQVNNCFIADNEVVNTYELQLVGNKIVILAPIDPSIKHY